MSPDSTARIMDALEILMGRNSVTRSLEAIKRYAVAADRIDDVILAASLCLVSDGDDRVAEGFNDDIARNGRNFGSRQPVIGCA
jgi:hypothetical protein